MSIPPKKSRRQTGTKKSMEKLPVFGQWVKTLSIIVGGVSHHQLAQYAGLDRSTVTKVIDPKEEENRKGPSAETVKKLWQAFLRLAEERGVVFAIGMETAFFNAAGGPGITEEQGESLKVGF